ncbi:MULTISPECIES: trypco2 family protein [unclassified Arthrobacter]|uniref:trypco2 family protein n=1 Tax=unclassified Arthrobacter TaxID=235627 RepID=UPI001CC7EDFB|nr:MULTISPECIES: trypco2 family protein [unclassified Arthrobacter]BCW52726.1 hypothetical protein StoSoilB19_01000 [Arthrobacter sp. StoSoilB19]BCW73775.1 hypothetical protein NicSoilB11_01000 [Arthrobacter sp. NicSoilB11]
MAGELELAELVAGLRAELERAREDGANAGIRFAVGPVELELSVVTEKKGTVEGGIKFWVVTAQTGGEISMTGTQRIRLTLQPSTGEGPLDIGDESKQGER